LLTLKLHIHTLLNLMLTPIIFPDIAKYNGRYSKGSYIKFFKLYIIYTLFEFKT